MSDLRGVGVGLGSRSSESDVIPTLRDILADTLDRIRAEVFDIHHTPPGDGAPPPAPADVPEPPQAAASAPCAAGARGIP